MRRYDEARALHEQALAVLVKNGQYDDIYATTTNNLAAVAMATGDYEGAKRYLAQTLEYYEGHEGLESTHYIAGLNNLAAADYLAGSYAEAQRLYERTLPIIEKVLGREHPDYARTVVNLARTREALARAEGARRTRSE
jgi:tetratricopeptide (TPR) repeat protein